MAAERLDMKDVLEVLRLRVGEGLSERRVSKALGVSRSTVHEYVRRFQEAGLVWPCANLDELALVARLFPARDACVTPVAPDFGAVAVELRRKGVTLRLLWEEYQSQHGARAHAYSWYCELYGRWRLRQRLSMRQEHKGGEKLFVDFSGDGLWLWDVQSGERTAVRVFVAAMGASSLVYAEAFADEKAESWLSGMTHALEYLGGVPQMVVPDNPRALVVRPDRHEAELTGSVKDWARHHGTTVMPARPYRPKDKAKVEVAVQVAQRWIMAVLRNERFESLATMNAAIGVLVERVNAREMRHIGRSRRSLFEELDRPALRSLPVNRYEYALWSTAVVHPDYHVQVDGQLYSVPHELRGERVNVRLTRGAVEVLKDGACVATHARASGHMRHHTQPGHMPPAHAAVMQQRSVDDVLRQACAAGAHVHVLAQRLMERRTHPEQALRGILGILSLQKTYGAERVDAACARALHFSLLKASAVKDILARSLDMVPHDPPSEENRTLTPVNFRGPQYFLH